MPANPASSDDKPGISKVKLAVGAASLFLFIVGVKRTFRTDEGKEFRSTRSGARDAPPAAPPRDRGR